MDVLHEQKVSPCSCRPLGVAQPVLTVQQRRSRVCCQDLGTSPLKMNLDVTSNPLTKIYESISNVLTCINLASHKENRENEVEETFEGIMADNATKLMKDINLHIQKVQDPLDTLKIDKSAHSAH